MIASPQDKNVGVQVMSDHYWGRGLLLPGADWYVGEHERENTESKD